MHARAGMLASDGHHTAVVDDGPYNGAGSMPTAVASPLDDLAQLVLRPGGLTVPEAGATVAGGDDSLAE